MSTDPIPTIQAPMVSTRWLLWVYSSCVVLSFEPLPQVLELLSRLDMQEALVTWYSVGGARMRANLHEPSSSRQWKMLRSVRKWTVAWAGCVCQHGPSASCICARVLCLHYCLQIHLDSCAARCLWKYKGLKKYQYYSGGSLLLL